MVRLYAPLPLSVLVLNGFPRPPITPHLVRQVRNASCTKSCWSATRQTHIFERDRARAGGSGATSGVLSGARVRRG